MYSDELTEHESQLGFIRVYMRNPRADFFLQGSIAPAVVYRLNLCDLIIKVIDPEGNPSYSHQMYGTYGPSGKVDWKPVLVPFPNAEMAIRSARRGSDQIGVGAMAVTIASPTIPLRCPDCGHEFDSQDDVIPFEHRQSCPACSVEHPIADFSAINT